MFGRPVSGARISVPGQIGGQDLVVAVKTGAQRGEVGMGGADAVQEQERLAVAGAVPRKSKGHCHHGTCADNGRTAADLQFSRFGCFITTLCGQLRGVAWGRETLVRGSGQRCFLDRTAGLVPIG